VAEYVCAVVAVRSKRRQQKTLGKLEKAGTNARSWCLVAHQLASRQEGKQLYCIMLQAPKIKDDQYFSHHQSYHLCPTYPFLSPSVLLITFYFLLLEILFCLSERDLITFFIFPFYL
jgi:hypothetical protein